MNTHDQLLESIVNDLLDGDEYYSIRRNVEYNSRAARGEIDILAFCDYNTLVIEVKSKDSYRSRRKAFKQLKRAVEHCDLLAGHTVRTMYAYGSGSEYVMSQVDVK